MALSNEATVSSMNSSPIFIESAPLSSVNTCSTVLSEFNVHQWEALDQRKQKQSLGKQQEKKDKNVAIIIVGYERLETEHLGCDVGSND